MNDMKDKILRNKYLIGFVSAIFILGIITALYA